MPPNNMAKKNQTDEAMRKARKVEKHELLTRKESVEVFKDGIRLGEKLKRLLRPSWFVKDLDEKRRKK